MSELNIKSKDQLGDRMKGYERVETDRVLDQTLPVYARIDGRGFSKFTRGMDKPFDSRLSSCMIETTRYLVQHTGALFGYTQSDEISLGWHLDHETNPKTQFFFDGKILKLTSVLAGMATAAFTRALYTGDSEFSKYASRLPHFDCRIFNLPDRDELANALLWRELDASRNAVSMLAQQHFSHRDLHGVGRAGLLEKLTAIRIDFSSYPEAFQRGTFVRRRIEEHVMDEEFCVRHGLPAGDPKVWTRSVMTARSLPPMLQIKNRTDVVYGAEPVI